MTDLSAISIASPFVSLSVYMYTYVHVYTGTGDMSDMGKYTLGVQDHVGALPWGTLDVAGENGQTRQRGPRVPWRQTRTKPERSEKSTKSDVSGISGRPDKSP